MSEMNAEPHYVRVINVGRRFRRGFDRIDSRSPLQKAGAWFLAILVGIPLAIILGFMALLLLSMAIVIGLASWLLGRPASANKAWSINRSPNPENPASRRENVRVVRNDRLS